MSALRDAAYTVVEGGNVLHIVESFGGGVANALLDYVANTPQFDHHLLYVERDDAPIGPEHLTPFVTTQLMSNGHLTRIREVRALAKDPRWDIIHAHSSFGGAYARIAARTKHVPIVYTPHCYASERKDVSRLGRFLYRRAEQVLAFNTSVFAACSAREARLSKNISGARVVFVPNIPPSTGIRRARVYDPRTPIRLVGAGRAAMQKDPDFFIECVAELNRRGVETDATWIGGDDALRNRAAAFSIRVSGWQPRSTALDILASADLYVHTAAWEGFPVAVLESVRVGVPTVVRSIDAFEGIDIPRFTSPRDFADLAELLIDEAALQATLNRAESALALHTAEGQSRALLETYKSAMSK